MRRNDRSSRRMGALRALAGAGVLALAMLSQPRTAAALPECAAYVSGRENHPAYGELIGSMTVKECAIIQGGIPGTGASYERCITYEVGYYQMAGGIEPLDCRNYTVWNG